MLGNDNKYYTVVNKACIIRSGMRQEAVRTIGTLRDVSELRNLQSEHYEERLKHKRRIALSVIIAQE
ncbi:MAG: hypothetical protein ACTHLE_22380 [Agriterribacter sp.]